MRAASPDAGRPGAGDNRVTLESGIMPASARWRHELRRDPGAAWAKAAGRGADMPRADMPKHDDPTEIEPRPKPPPMTGSEATSSQLRRDIDSGADGDKVAMFDPAAAPLGSDAEASGVPPTPGTVALARRTERAGQVRPPDPSSRADDRAWMRLAAALGILVLLGAIAVWAGTL
jgi:hypothetical protein